MSTNERAPGEGFLVLWAGGVEIAERDTQVELRRAGVRVEVTSAEELAARANERAPDLVVLGGELGEDPEPHATTLSNTSPSAAVPIVALAPHNSAAPRPRARFGLVARFDRELDPPQLAAQLSTLLHGLSTRPPVWRVNVRSGALGPIASRFAALHRAGLLTLPASGAIAIEAGGGVAPDSLDAKPNTTEAAFHERPPGRVWVRRAHERESAKAESLDGVRVLVVEDDAERRERLTRELEQAGAQVRATGLVAQAIHASRALDPTVIVIGAPSLRSNAAAALWNEPRLAPAALLVLDGEALARPLALVSDVALLARPEASLRAALQAQKAIAERLETLGPARWLKLLGACRHEITMRVFAAAGRMRVDLAGGRIQGASFHPAEGDDVIDGRAAVDALMTIPFGRVLAGPPDALAALEGVSAKRKPSVVGRIEGTPASGVRRKQGLVSEEIVVKTTDATQRPIAPPKSVRVPAPTLASFADDDDDEATSAYAAETIAGLRAALRAGEGDRDAVLASTEPPPTRARGEKVKPDPARPGASTDDRDVAVAPPTRALGDEVKLEAMRDPDAALATTEPPPTRARGEKVKPEVAPKSGAVVTAELPRVIEASAAPIDTSMEPPARSSEPVRTTDAPRIFEPQAPVPAHALPTPGPRRGGNGIWFAGGIALALGVGGWAAWTMHGEDAPSLVGTRADRPSELDVFPERTASHVAIDREPDPSLAPAPPEPSPQLAEESETRTDEPPVAEEHASESDTAVEHASESDTAVEHASESDTAEEHAIERHTAAPVELEPASDARVLIADAAEAARVHDYARSEALSRRALELSPRNARAGYRLAVALFRQNRLTDAIQTARDVSTWDREDPLALALIGDIYTFRGQFRQAARAYRQALEVDPEFAPAQRNLERLRERGVTEP